MAKNKKQLPVLEQVMVTDLAAEGKAIAKVNDVVVFIPFAVPGDVVNLQVTRKKSSFMEARVIDMVQPSEIRQESFCEHFGICGGCKWQILPYEEQLKYKQKEVEKQPFIAINSNLRFQTAAGELSKKLIPLWNLTR